METPPPLLPPLRSTFPAVQAVSGEERRGDCSVGNCEVDDEVVDDGGGGGGGGGDQKAGRTYHHQRQCERVRERDSESVHFALQEELHTLSCPVLSCLAKVHE